MATRLLLLALLFLTIENSFAQTYEQAIDDCNNQSMNAPSSGSFEKDMTARITKLRECIIGNKFPAFTATSLTGKSISKNELKDKVVLINLWFITCAPCVSEMPLLNDLDKEFKDKGFLLLGFSTDGSESLKKFLRERQISYDVFADSKGLIDNTFKLAAGGYPTSIFLNKKGEIVEYVTGGATNEQGLKKTKEEFREIIKKELAK